MQKFILFILFAVSICEINAQKPITTSVFAANESQMKTLGDKILRGTSEAEKINANLAFIKILEETLSNPSSFNYPFDSLVTIARLTSPDRTFRIYNWHMVLSDGTFEFFAYIQPNLLGKNKKQLKNTKPFYKLINVKESKTAIENKVLSANEWYGAHYYKIVQIKEKQEKNYLLLGWDGNNPYSNKKLIDVLNFNSLGEPKFGAAIFKMENNKLQKRVIFEYAKDASMSLRYNDNNMIIFDHLVPPNPSLKGSYSSYGPDFSYDAFEYKKGIWNYVPDVEAKNSKSTLDKKWTHPRSK
jgi:hypothetical protein